jgi:crooked neck
MMPMVSKRRHVDQETGQTVEDWDLVFADDEREANPTSFKFLQMAHAWKKRLGTGGAGVGVRATESASGMLSSFVAAASSSSSRREEEDDDEESDAASSRDDSEER